MPPFSPKITPLSTDDLDECYFFIDYLERKDIIKTRKARHFDGPADICNYINNSLAAYFRDNPDKINGVISDMLYSLKRKTPPEGEVAWIKSDKRACFWLWTEIYCLNHDDTPREEVKGFIAHSHQERHREVMQKYKEFHLNYESRRWNKMINKWSKIKEYDSLLGCLPPDDENVIFYTWKYLCSHGHYIDRIYTPLDDEERYLSILNYIDFYLTHPLEKELLVRKIKPAIN